MNRSQQTIDMEDRLSPPFAKKTPISIERGEGVTVWDEDGRKYLDFTAGWGVTCLGHAHPSITQALTEQSRKILQNPNSGATYSPARAALLDRMQRILPTPLTRVFFTNSGAEADDAALKLARKATGRTDVIATLGGFHGRTIGTISATGQAGHRDRFNPLMPGFRFVPFDDADAMAQAMDRQTAAVIIEPIQGEGGVNIPADGYLAEVRRSCDRNGTLLIIDEVQTGMCRTGPMFAVEPSGVAPDILTAGKGLGGGFPIAALAMTEAVASRLERGDHGGTYCGNPLACAVASGVIDTLVNERIGDHVAAMGEVAMAALEKLQLNHPALVKAVRGRGLLIAIEVASVEVAEAIRLDCLARGLILNVTQSRLIRVIPALNIEQDALEKGLGVLSEAFAQQAEA